MIESFANFWLFRNQKVNQENDVCVCVCVGFGFVDNALHLVQPTASCLISQADKEIKTVSCRLLARQHKTPGFYSF